MKNDDPSCLITVLLLVLAAALWYIGSK